MLDTAEFDIVHTNVEFAETSSRASDHDPLVARFDLTPDNGGGSDDEEEEPNGTGEDLEEGTGNNTGEESGESGEAASEDVEDSGEAASEDVEDSGEANPESAENVETSEIAGTTIEGTDEFDVLTGTAGDDEISGGEGSDILAGGEGRDTFVYDSIEDSIDLLTDYQVGEDRLDVSQIFDNAEIAASSIDFWEIAQGTVVLFDDGSETRPLALVLGVTETELDRPENFIV
ncbi:MAG: M10 family metallopeptidase C-terminal domain-containing protein [Cyanobacteria bacterium SID2]|nr:M10 family metallopeptidase C-terminal domain-containing protein [Cyanobacteria bacterium SID2]